MADPRANVQRSTANTPSIASSTTALAANSLRAAWSIQNLDGSNPLFVLRGSGASSTVFHTVLKVGSVNDDGTGGSISESGPVVFTGIISVYSAGTPRYTVTEM